MGIVISELLGLSIYLCLTKFSMLQRKNTKAKILFFLLISLIILAKAYKYSTGTGLDLDEAEGGG